MNNKYGFQNQDYSKKYDKYKKKYIELKNEYKINVNRPNKNILNQIGSSREDNNNLNKIYNMFVKGPKKDKNDLKMVLGAGNINMYSYDYSNYHNLYDIVLTDDDMAIDDNITEPVALCMDFNNIDQLDYLRIFLSGRFSKIILDVSTNKFIEWNSNILKIFNELLGQNGKLYIDTNTYMRFSITEDTIVGYANSPSQTLTFGNYIIHSVPPNLPNEKQKYIFTLKPDIFNTIPISYYPTRKAIDVDIPQGVKVMIHNNTMLKASGFRPKPRMASYNEPYPLYFDESKSSSPPHNETMNPLVYKVPYIVAMKK